MGTEGPPSAVFIRQQQIAAATHAVNQYNDLARRNHTELVRVWRVQKEFVESTGRGELGPRPPAVRLWAWIPDEYMGARIVDAELFDIQDIAPGVVAVLGPEMYPGAGMWIPGDGDNAPLGTRIAAFGRSFVKIERTMGWGAGGGPFGFWKTQVYVPE